MTRPTEPARIAVLDIGKTNLKLLVASEDGWPLETHSIPNAANASGPYLAYDLAGLSELCWRDTEGRSFAEIHFCRDFADDRTDRPSKESEPPPLLRMKRSSALTRGIFKRSMGTIALIQRSGTGKSGSGTTKEPLRISASAT